MKPYILLTPGPLTTTETVKEAMMTDWCTWDEDYNVHIVEEIRNSLVALSSRQPDEYTSILLQGSGTYCVEAVIGSTIKPGDKLLILSNGAYGDRMGNIAEYHGIDYDLLAFDETEQISVSYVDDYLAHNADITHVAIVHCETTTGILNPLKDIAHIVKMYGKRLIVDAMSSFGGVDIPVGEWGIDFIISSANKCIQGVPGFSFIIANKQKLIEFKGKARSLSLDLYDQWETMNKDGKWRFTSPTHVVLAFYQALKEMEAEGGIPARHQRYVENNRLLIEKMKELGIRPYIDEEHQGPIIATFFYPENASFSFADMYQYIKERGYAIYSGKVTEADTFRIGNIGEIYKEDILKVSELIKEFLEQNR